MGTSFPTKVGVALEELHGAEADLAVALLRLADRHQDDHEIRYLGRDLARWSQEHVERLAAVGREHGLDLDREPGRPGIVTALREKGESVVRRSEDAGLVLLADLRDIHRQAAGVSLDWEVLAQTAQALRDHELLSVCKDCHPETLRQMRWANAKVKESAAQVMVSE